MEVPAADCFDDCFDIEPTLDARQREANDLHEERKVVRGARTIRKKPQAATSTVGPSARGVPHAEGQTAESAEPGLCGRTPMPGGDMRIAADLLAVRDSEERMRLVRGMLSVIGFRELAYMTVRPGDEACGSSWAIEANTQRHFGAEYFDAGYHLHDPRLASVLRSNAPLAWDMQWLVHAWRRDGAPPSLRGLFQALEEDDIRSGVMFGITIVPSGLRAVVSLGAGAASRDWIDCNVMTQALTLGLSLHRAMSEPAHHGQQDELSEMQLRILTCLGSGLSDKQIAQRLQTTAHNVDYHLRILRRRYGAANRIQLAFLAGAMALG